MAALHRPLHKVSCHLGGRERLGLTEWVQAPCSPLAMPLMIKLTYSRIQGKFTQEWNLHIIRHLLCTTCGRWEYHRFFLENTPTIKEKQSINKYLIPFQLQGGSRTTSLARFCDHLFNDPQISFDPTSFEVTCVTLPKDHCIQVLREYINVYVDTSMWIQ